MKNKFLMALIGLTLTLSMVLGILAGCGAPATPTATVAPTGTATAKPTVTAKPTTTAAPTPTKAGEVIKWRFQSGSSAGDAGWWMQKEFCEYIKIASNGRLELTLFPAGAIVARMEILDAVSTGAIEAGMNNDNDWEGKDFRIVLGDIPAGMQHAVQLAWFFYRNPDNLLDSGNDPILNSTPDGKATPGGVTVSPGNRLFDEIFGKLNVKAFPYTGGREVNYMANKKLLKPADYKGSTFRASGWEQRCIMEFGGKPITMPSSDVYTALQTGLIDATQAGTTSSNWVTGYQDITKYWGYPGMHNLGQSNHFLINMDVWKKLPADLQMIVQLATEHYYLTTMAFTDVQDAWMQPKLPDKGITVVYLSPEQQMNWRSAMLKTASYYVGLDPNFAGLLDRTLKFQYMVDAYFDLQNPVYDATYPGSKYTYKGFVWQ